MTGAIPPPSRSAWLPDLSPLPGEAPRIGAKLNREIWNVLRAEDCLLALCRLDRTAQETTGEICPHRECDSVLSALGKGEARKRSRTGDAVGGRVTRRRTHVQSGKPRQEDRPDTTVAPGRPLVTATRDRKFRVGDDERNLE